MDAGNRPRFWWSPTEGLIRGGGPDTVPLDYPGAVELVPRTETEPPSDEAGIERMAEAMVVDEGRSWSRMWENNRAVWRNRARSALAAWRRQEP